MTSNKDLLLTFFHEESSKDADAQANLEWQIPEDPSSREERVDSWAFSSLLKEKHISVQSSLTNLASLTANATESFTCAFFLVDEENDMLKPCGFQTLSNNFALDCKIPIGAGYVGWTAKSHKKLSVSPFEKDSRSLLYYKNDEMLKSFIAMPVLSADDSLMGVLACDSKKSYAYTRLSEKIMLDATTQAAILINLYGKLRAKEDKNLKTTPSPTDNLYRFLDEIRAATEENCLFENIVRLNKSILPSGALAVVVNAELGVGEPKIYSFGKDSRLEQRLLELINRHKQIELPKMDVQAFPNKELTKRSFMSVPFTIAGDEAGSINVLSDTANGFSSKYIETLEKVAKESGRSLELIRLRDHYTAINHLRSELKPAHFVMRSNLMLKNALSKNINMALIRIHIKALFEVEKFFGMTEALRVNNKFARILEQVAGSQGLSTQIHSGQFLMLVEQKHVERSFSLIDVMLKRSFIESNSIESIYEPLTLNDQEFIRLLLNGIEYGVASTLDPDQDWDAEDLIAGSLKNLESSIITTEKEQAHG